MEEEIDVIAYWKEMKTTKVYKYFATAGKFINTYTIAILLALLALTFTIYHFSKNNNFHGVIILDTNYSNSGVVVDSLITYLENDRKFYLNGVPISFKSDSILKQIKSVSVFDRYSTPPSSFYQDNPLPKNIELEIYEKQLFILELETETAISKEVLDHEVIRYFENVPFKNIAFINARKRLETKSKLLNEKLTSLKGLDKIKDSENDKLIGQVNLFSLLADTKIELEINDRELSKLKEVILISSTPQIKKPVNKIAYYYFSAFLILLLLIKIVTKIRS